MNRVADEIKDPPADLTAWALPVLVASSARAAAKALPQGSPRVAHPHRRGVAPGQPAGLRALQALPPGQELPSLAAVLAAALARAGRR